MEASICLLLKQLWIYSEKLAVILLWLLMNALREVVNMLMQKRLWSLRTDGLTDALQRFSKQDNSYGYTQNLFPIVQGGYIMN